MKKHLPVIILGTVLLVWVGAIVYGKLRYSSGNDPYLNYTEQASDGFRYWTSEKNTDNFVAYKYPEGDIRLYPINEDLAKKGRFCEVEPRGLCKDLQAGEAYTITYDMQLCMGGIAGVQKAWFLKVYDCVPADTSPDKLFENASDLTVLQKGSGGRDDPFGSESILYVYKLSDEQIIITKTGRGYTAYSSSFGRREYDEMRTVPYERTPGHSEDMYFLCSSGTTDSQLIQDFRNDRLTTDPDALYIDLRPAD